MDIRICPTNDSIILWGERYYPHNIQCLERHSHPTRPPPRWGRPAPRPWSPARRRWRSPPRSWCRCSDSTAWGSPWRPAATGEPAREQASGGEDTRQREKTSTSGRTVPKCGWVYPDVITISLEQNCFITAFNNIHKPVAMGKQVCYMNTNVFALLSTKSSSLTSMTLWRMGLGDAFSQWVEHCSLPYL